MTLDANYDDENIFAKLIRGEIQSSKIEETNDTISFMDLFPQCDGHCLVIPKNCKATNIFDIPLRDLEILISQVQRIAKAVKASLAPDGVRIIQFNGTEAGQTVFHIHFHVIPYYAGKAERPHDMGSPADTDELNRLAAKIKAKLP